MHYFIVMSTVAVTCCRIMEPFNPLKMFAICKDYKKLKVISFVITVPLLARRP